MIYSIPQISGGFGTELSHEAAIGKIAKDKIEYLMTRRMTEETAVSVIIRGFLNVKVKHISLLNFILTQYLSILSNMSA